MNTRMISEMRDAEGQISKIDSVITSEPDADSIIEDVKRKEKETKERRLKLITEGSKQSKNEG